MARFDKGKEAPKQPEPKALAEEVPAPASDAWDAPEPTATSAAAEVPMAEMVTTPEPPQATSMPAKAKASTPGHTLCRVINTDIFYRGNLIAEGTVAEFDDATVLGMPTVLVSLE